MYDILDLNWKDLYYHETLRIKTKTSKFLIELKGSDIPDTICTDSDILIFYDYRTGRPCVLIDRMVGNIEVSPIDPALQKEGWIIEVEHFEEDGIKMTDVKYILEEIYVALE